jgi:hypothetical protein
VWLKDASGAPVVMYPSSDIWMETCTCPEGYPGIVCALGGCCANAPTNAAGYTLFAQPLRAGCCGCEAKVLINGVALNQPCCANHLFNSPDMNCDLVVNLSDVVMFAGAFFSGYDYCADLNYNGALNLGDVVVLAQHMGHGQ